MNTIFVLVTKLHVGFHLLDGIIAIINKRFSVSFTR